MCEGRNVPLDLGWTKCLRGRNVGQSLKIHSILLLNFG